MKLTIVPLSKIPDEVMNAIRESLRDNLRLVSDIAQQIEPPKQFYNAIRHQYMADDVLDFLATAFKGRTIGITVDDIYTDGLTFIFGEANALRDVAVLSLHRLNPSFYKQPADTNLFLERAVKEVLHECGHMLGLRHCQTPKCVMQFSNNVIDVDRKTKDLCADCKRYI